MALTKELKQAYEEAGVTADQITKLEEVFTDEEILSKLTAQHMKAADYTTKTQALADARKELDKQTKEFNEGRNYLDTQTNAWKADLETRLNQQIKQAADSRVYGAALESKLTALAAEYGLDPATLLGEVKDMREKEPEAKKDAFDDTEFKKRYIPREEFQATADAAFAFPSMIRDFERDYQRTFGKEYEGNLTELVADASKEVQARRARGQNADLFSIAKEKLDFSGQAVRNKEAATAKEIADKESWQKQTREEIERDVRSKILAENPSALRDNRFATKPEAWRNNLNAAARKNTVPQHTPQEEYTRRNALHAKFEELAVKADATA